MQIKREQWQQLQQQWQTELDDSSFHSWIAPLKLGDSDSLTTNTVTVTAPTRFMRDWVAKHYETLIRKSVVELTHDESVNIEFVVDQKPATSLVDQITNTASASAKGQTIATHANGPRIGTPLDSRNTFANFVQGDSNQFALAAAQKIATANEILYNPLFIHGSVGLGKTHLMHAIAHQKHQQQPGTRVLYLSAEKFLFGFIKALRDKTALSFKDQFRDVDVLMIDDIQFIAGKDATQQEFLHTFNALVESGKQVILSADRAPHDLIGLDDRMRSRLSAGLTVEIKAPDHATRISILQHRAKVLGLHLPEDVTLLIAEKITSNVRELVGALNRLAAHAELSGAEITVEFAKNQLRDLLQAYQRMVTIDDIQRSVSEYYQLKVADLHGVRRTRQVARPRQIAMYLCKQLTTRSYPEIGRHFGGRDHTTIIHGCRTIDGLMPKDESLRKDVDILTRMLKG